MPGCTYEHKVGPRNGAKVARAWNDPAFKTWLLEDATEAIASLGHAGRQGEHMMVLRIRRKCTTSSFVLCAPAIRGQSRIAMVWLGSAYGRVVADHAASWEFETELSDDVEVRVWDSTAEMRYLVLPLARRHHDWPSENLRHWQRGIQ